VVISSDGYVLCETGAPSWAVDKESSVPPVYFPDPESALAAYLWAREIGKAREYRHDHVLRRLGLL
jgi:hypothetical protein